MKALEMRHELLEREKAEHHLHKEKKVEMAVLKSQLLQSSGKRLN